MYFVFKMIRSFLNKFLVSQGYEGVHPLVDEWVRHYFFGGGKEKRLPKEAVPETKEAVIERLKDLGDNPNWNTGVARVGEGHSWAWFTSLSGVVGGFNFRLEEEEGGLLVRCWDKWDFNSPEDAVWDEEAQEEKVMCTYLTLPCPPILRDKIIKVAKGLGITLDTDDPGSLGVREDSLSVLNQGRAFMTRWEFFITWEELGIKDPSRYDWGLGGLPKSWVKAQAQMKQVYRLGGKITEGNIHIYVDGEELNMPLNWESINQLREKEKEGVSLSSRRKRRRRKTE